MGAVAPGGRLCAPDFAPCNVLTTDEGQQIATSRVTAVEGAWHDGALSVCDEEDVGARC